MTSDLRAPRSPKATTRRRGAARRARGVTLLELMAVIAIIGIFMVLAAPSLSRTFDDRRAGNIADDIAQMFRTARTRAAATGGAHAILVQTVGTQLRFDLMESIDPVTKQATGSCFAPSWSVTGADIRLLETLNGATDPRMLGKNITIVPTGTNTGTICYTPGGAMWIRAPGGSTWARPVLANHYDYEIHRTDSAGTIIGLVRFVRIGTTGVPRVDVQG